MRVFRRGCPGLALHLLILVLRLFDELDGGRFLDGRVFANSRCCARFALLAFLG
jgi:hypothetical protein